MLLVWLWFLSMQH